MSVNGFVHDVGTEPLTSPVSLTQQLLHSSPTREDLDVVEDEDVVSHDIAQRVAEHLQDQDTVSVLHPDLIAQTEAQLQREELARQQQQQQQQQVQVTVSVDAVAAAALTSPISPTAMGVPGGGPDGLSCPVCNKSFAAAADPNSSYRSHERHMIGKGDEAHKQHRIAKKEAKSKAVAASAKSKARDRVRKFRAARAEEARKQGPMGVDRAKIQSKSATERRKLKREVDAIPPPGPPPQQPANAPEKPLGNPYYLLGEIVGIKPPSVTLAVETNETLSAAVEAFRWTLSVVAPGRAVSEIFQTCSETYIQTDPSQQPPWDEAASRYEEDGSHEEMLLEYIEYVRTAAKHKEAMQKYQIAIQEHREKVESYEKMRDIEARVKENVNNWWQAKGRLRASNDAGDANEEGEENSPLGENMDEDHKLDAPHDPDIDPQITGEEQDDEVMVDPNTDLQDMGDET